MANYDTLPKDSANYKKITGMVEGTRLALLKIGEEVSQQRELVGLKVKSVEEVRKDKGLYFNKAHNEVQTFLTRYQNTNGAYKQQFIMLRTIAQGIISSLDETGFVAKEPVAAALPVEAIPIQSEEGKLTLDEFFQ